MKSSKILIGRDALKNYIGIRSDQALDDFLKMGLPHLVHKRRIYACAENVDQFFKEITVCQGPPDPEAT